MKAVRPRSHHPVATALLAFTIAPGVRAAEEAPDVGQLVDFIRWSGLFASLFVIVGAGVLARFLKGLVDRLGESFPDKRLTLQKVESFVRFGLYIATGAVVTALSFRINQTVLALVGGTLAVAVGFAMRDLVAAMIAGVIIMFDRPFQVGDRVEFAGEYGDVTAIGLRSVRIQTLDDNTVTVPNNKVLTDVTSCGNYGALDMQVSVEFFIGIDQDVELTERLVREAMLTSQFVHLEKPVVTLVKEVIQENYVALRVVAKGYVLDTKYESAFGSDVTKRALSAFRAHGIAPPAVLHRTIG